jgi:hypothetical protein
MTLIADHTAIAGQFVFYDRAHHPLPVDSRNLTLLRSEDTVTECRLTIQVTYDQYCHIDAAALFNLGPGTRGPRSQGDFLPDQAIAIELALKTEYLPHLLDQGATAEAAAAVLSQLSQEPPVTPDEISDLLRTESWLALSVKQTQPDGEPGYTTLWHYLNPASWRQSEGASDRIAAGIVNFVKDWTEANLTAATKEATTGLLDGVSKFFSELEDWVDQSFADDADEPIPAPTLLDTIANFFDQENWPYGRIAQESALKFAFSGEQGRWNGYAKTDESQRQVIFYSFCPLEAPAERRLAVAEFLTRANYGLIIGNFELDFSDGEIRYKTSLDVEADRLTPALVKQLVYANLFTFDKYLPGILAVIEGVSSPENAIASIEA